MAHEKITSWSPSRLKTYQDCPHKAYLMYVERIPTEKTPAMQRGIDIHKGIELYIKGETDQLPITDEGSKKKLDLLEHRFPIIPKLREEYPKGDVIVEQQWAFDYNWEACDWFAPNVWGRVTLDALWLNTETNCMHIYDWKTGKKQGNEVHHAAQGVVYALASYYRYPKLNDAEIHFVYVDMITTLDRRLPRARAALFMDQFKTRIDIMLNDTEHRPIPAKWVCKYCPYGLDNQAVCQYAYAG